MTSRPSTAAPLLAILAIIAAGLGGYAAGYFWLGQRKDYIGLSAPSRVEVIERHYSQPWLATVYQPAGKLEELLRRVDVEVMHGAGKWRSIDFR